MERLAFYRQLGLRVDLALEAHALLRGATRQEIPGVKEEKEQFDFATVTTIDIFSSAGEKAMGRPQGVYITIEAPHLSRPLPEKHDSLIELLAAKIRLLCQRLGLLPQADVLIVGLGNWQATPDSLGPRVVEQCLVTRQLHRYAPQAIPPSLRSVSAVAPGVLGLTGIETLEIVKGVVEHVHPGLVIAVDALAAQEVKRLGTTIQLTDTGLNPGSGIGQTRGGLNQYTLGPPVLAIGVPTVVQAPVLAYELFARLPWPGPKPPQEALTETVQTLLAPFGGELTVTPKEIDALIDHVSATVATGLNRALYPELTPEEIAYLS